MTATYKVWISIERIDEDNDSFEDVNLPESVATYDTEEEAIKFAASLASQGNLGPMPNLPKEN